jgi:tetratricopeptide (TPR) repeat protein
LNKELKTEKMQANKNKIDDLDYLAQLGFEQLPISDSDLVDLNAKIKKRIFSYNNGFYFGLISLIVGVFIGVSVFFVLDNAIKIYSPDLSNKILEAKKFPEKKVNEQFLSLDTINVVRENFINPIVNSKRDHDTLSQPLNKNLKDTAIIIQTQPIDLSTLVDNNFPESKIKYILNAPVAYIHDLKVTNYVALYFKKNQYIKFPVRSGLPVSYANKEEFANSRSGLKQNADYYLHEEFSEALLTFKKGNYKPCIYALNVISAYNKEDINCDFYLGMCFYYTKNYQKAIEYFKACIENSNNTFLQEATYYQALSLFENGDKETAIQSFKDIAQEGEFYSEKAKLFLKNNP